MTWLNIIGWVVFILILGVLIFILVRKTKPSAQVKEINKSWVSTSRLPNIERMKAGKNISGLIGALSYPGDHYVRLSAARALGELGDARAIQPLIDAFHDTSIQGTVAIALSRFKDPIVVQHLVNALQDPRVDSNVSTALVVLGWQPDQIDQTAANFWIKRAEEVQYSFGIAAREQSKLIRKQLVSNPYSFTPLVLNLLDDDFYARMEFEEEWELRQHPKQIIFDMLQEMLNSSIVSSLPTNTIHKLAQLEADSVMIKYIEVDTFDSGDDIVRYKHISGKSSEKKMLNITSLKSLALQELNRRTAEA